MGNRVNGMRKKLYQMVHVYENGPLSTLYKYSMIVFILISLLPLVTKERYAGFRWMELVCLSVFIIDYFLRWLTADYKLKDGTWKAFLKYPFRLISIIDLMSIVALAVSFFGWFSGLKLAKALTVFRIVRIFRYSKSVRRILAILRNSRKPLMAVGSLAIGYIFISAIVIFNVEPDSFDTFFDAIYWATVSLTTVGYGDLYPITTVGRTVAMLSSFFGIAIVALPAGIVTAEYLNTVKEQE